MGNIAYADFRKPRAEGERVADTDDGYTRLANELYEELIGAALTRNQAKVAHAVCRKTYGYNKKTDRISDNQLSELTKLPRQKVNKAKNELLEMKVLISDGKKIGPNKNLSEWEINECHQNGVIVTKTVTKSVTKTVTGLSPKQGHTKDNIQNTKEITPISPQGEEIECAEQALKYYNQTSGLTCRSAEPFLKLLTSTSTRKAYTLDEVCLVTRWALSAWKTRNKSLPKPENICRVTRFDGYLADAEKWQQESVEIDCQAVIDAYNEITEGRMPPAELDRDREIAIKILASRLAKKNIDGFCNYFNAFLMNAREFYFGGPDGSGWCANFDTLMKPETLRKVKEGAL
jgi:phage replication O-like protein O